MTNTERKYETTAMEGIIDGAFFPQNVSAYFKRPLKVVKPNSRNQSPRNNGRRRMTTHLPARTRSVADSQRPILGTTEQRHRSLAPARPMSWHPNLAFESADQNLYQQQFHHQPTTFGSTSFAYGQATPNPFPVMEGSYDCPNVSLDLMTGHDFAFSQQAYQTFQPSPYDCDTSRATYTPVYYTPVFDPRMEARDFQAQSIAWPPLTSSNFQAVATAPSSPDFLPMLDLGKPFGATHFDNDNNQDELIGMGLYDSPAQIQSASLLGGGSLPVRRKSLKLEESFEPAPDAEESEEDAESESDEEEVGSSQHQQNQQMRQQQQLDACGMIDMIQGRSRTTQIYEHPASQGQVAYGWI